MKTCPTLKKSDSLGTINGINPGSTAEELMTKVSAKSGSVEIQDINGAVKNTGKVCTGDKVVLKDAEGKAVFSYNIVIYGDVNGDGNASIKDLLIIKKYLLGAGTIEGVYLYAADVNRDGSDVSIKDILVLQKYILGVSTINQE